jgi:phosphoribosylaminoimidazole-succinocarboxamide synthase
MSSIKVISTKELRKQEEVTEKEAFIEIFKGNTRTAYAPTGIFIKVSDKCPISHIVACEHIPNKGAVINCITQENKKFLESVGFKTDYLPLGQDDLKSILKLPGNVAYVKKLSMIPLNFVVIGFLTESAYNAYNRGEFSTEYAKQLSEANELDKLLNPIVIPVVKDKLGNNNVISEDEAIVIITEWLTKTTFISLEDFDYDESNGPVMFSKQVSKRVQKIANAQDMMEELEELLQSIKREVRAYAENMLNEIYEKAILAYTELSEEYTKGDMIILDTKFEFGLDELGDIILAGEVGTPDNSRLAVKSVFDESGKVMCMDRNRIEKYCETQGYLESKHVSKPIPKECMDRIFQIYYKVATDLYGSVLLKNYLT